MIGTILGNRYELLEKIGEGGMAEVYKAKCKLLDRFVSVKILKKEYSADANFVEKFKREASAAASLSHNNIVTIYDVGSQDGINYIVLEYVKGKTLKDIINQEGKLDYNVAVQIAIQIAKALECAHKNNIIHRDIKPHNILITEEGVVKVTDFGIAKASNSVTITNASKVMGSAHYFSPEQAKGNVVDCRSDIYSLGIVLYEMVTGRVPYDAESPVSVALKHIQEPVIPPKQLSEDMPDNLNKVILKAIEKEPIKRYQNVKDMLWDLRKIQNCEEVNIVTENPSNDETRVMDPIVVEENYDEEDYDDESKVGSKTKKIILGITIVVLISCLGILCGKLIVNKVFYKGGSSSSISKDEVKVPKLVDVPQEEAKKLVEDAGLKFLVTGKQKSDKKEGLIIACNPEEGKVVKKNSTIRVIVSLGSKSATLPDFKDMDINSVKDTLSNLKLKLGNVSEQFSDTVPKDYIIKQNPAPDSDIKEGDKIDLVVSKGPESKNTIVPNLIDKNVAQASAILANSKLKLGTQTEILTSDEKLDGKILTQSIEPNETVKQGIAINITYYKYKKVNPAEQP